MPPLPAGTIIAAYPRGPRDTWQTVPRAAQDRPLCDLHPSLHGMRPHPVA